MTESAVVASARQYVRLVCSELLSEFLLEFGVNNDRICVDAVVCAEDLANNSVGALSHTLSWSRAFRYSVGDACSSAGNRRAYYASQGMKAPTELFSFHDLRSAHAEAFWDDKNIKQMQHIVTDMYHTYHPAEYTAERRKYQEARAVEAHKNLDKIVQDLVRASTCTRARLCTTVFSDYFAQLVRAVQTSVKTGNAFVAPCVARPATPTDVPANMMGGRLQRQPAT